MSWNPTEVDELRLLLHAVFSPVGSELLALHHAGVKMATIELLYPQEFEHARGLDLLPQLLSNVELPALQDLIRKHAEAIFDGWEQAFHNQDLEQRLGLITVSPSTMPPVRKWVEESTSFRKLVIQCGTALVNREDWLERVQLPAESNVTARATALIFFYFPSLLNDLPEMSETGQSEITDLLTRYEKLLAGARNLLEFKHLTEEKTT